VKNDSRYIYLIHNNELIIIDGQDVSNGKIVSQTKVLDWLPNSSTTDAGTQNKPSYYDQQKQMRELLVKDNTAIVFVQAYEPDTYLAPFDLQPIDSSRPKTVALLVDISDRANPKKIGTIEATGDYGESRLIGNKVYFIA